VFHVPRFRFSCFGYRLQGFRPEVSGFGFRVSGSSFVFLSALLCDLGPDFGSKNSCFGCVGFGDVLVDLHRKVAVRGNPLAEHVPDDRL